MELSGWKALSTAESSCVVKRDVCIRKDLIAHVVLSGGTDISFQSVIYCEVCIRKELHAECLVVGCTAVFQLLVERMTRNRTTRQRLHAHAPVYGGGEFYW